MLQTCPNCGGTLPADEFEGLCPRCVALCLDAPENPDDSGQAVESDQTATRLESSSQRTAAAHDNLPPSGTLIGRSIRDYDLIEEIGRGGMGVVYRARQVSLNRIVAVKTILAGPVASAEAVQRFQGEAEALAKLKHPNIVAIYDVFEQDSHHFFSMEYVPGKNLADLTREQPLASEVVARYAQRVASAIHFAHKTGLLHRDLKPSNILIDPFDEPRVTDFGLAKRLNAQTDLSYTGQLVGSPQYFSPEQLSAKKGAVSPRSDVYSIGAVLYHLLTGRPPFNAATLEEVLLQVIDAEPPRPRSLEPQIPRDLETICLKCMEKDPPRRYASAQAVADDLGRFLAGEPITARPVGAAERAWRWWLRRKALAGAWAAIALLLVAFAFALYRRNAGPAPSATAPLPLTEAYNFSDQRFYDTNWTLSVLPTEGSNTHRARQILGYTNSLSSSYTNPVREITYRVKSNSTVVAFHLNRNATYDPALRGEIRELAASISSHQIDGAGNTRVAPYLEQAGQRYTYIRPQTADPAELVPVRFRGMTASDFALQDGLDFDRRHPDFSIRGKPIQFGFVMRDTDPNRAHAGRFLVGDFGLTAFGPPPAAFPFTDSSFDPNNWSVIPRIGGSPVTWTEVQQDTGGNPGKFMWLTLTMGDKTTNYLMHVCHNAVYWPAKQGAITNLDISLDVRMAAATSGKNLNAAVNLVIVQNGTVYVTGAHMATYSDQNGGWAPLEFAGRSAHDFNTADPMHQIGPTYWADFSTNGAPMRFGFATYNNTFYNNPEGRGFKTAIEFDNFVVKVHPVPAAPR